jgi:hypothetical protein
MTKDLLELALRLQQGNTSRDLVMPSAESGEWRESWRTRDSGIGGWGRERLVWRPERVRFADMRPT